MDDYDPRQIALYDEDNPDGPDHDFYRDLAHQIDAGSIVDLGCGTGMLTVTLAAPGRSVVGVDPSTSMIDYARRRTGGELVTWVVGDSRAIEGNHHDLALMTGNVAQHIPETNWPRTLADLAGALRPGGVLAFETRNPAVRAWEAWAAATPTSRDTADGELVEWFEVEHDPSDVVTLVSCTRLVETGEVRRHTQLLTFRERGEVEAALAGAGFEVEVVYGDWHRTPLSAAAPVMVFVARRR